MAHGLGSRVVRTFHPLIAAALLAASASLAAEPLAARARGDRPQRRDVVYVAVADDRGRPVRDLTAADFAITLDGASQEVLAVGPATEPVSTIILTDRLGLSDAYSHIGVQRALSSFVARIRKAAPGSRFALTTFDGPVVRLLGFSAPPAELDRQIGRLTTLAGDAALLDGLTDACRLMNEAPTSRRVVLLVYAGYRPETSTAQPELVGAMLQASGASLWAIEAQIPGAPSGHQVNRELVVDQGTGITGGRRDTVSSAVGVDTMATQIATLIGAHYEVTYGPGGGTVNSQRKVVVKRPGLKVYAPAWIRR
jgi:hypothetical protein